MYMSWVYSNSVSLVYSLSHEYHYCATLQQPTARTKTAAFISLLFFPLFNFTHDIPVVTSRGAAARGSNQMLHSVLPFNRLSRELRHVTNQIFHCGWPSPWDMVLETQLMPLKYTEISNQRTSIRVQIFVHSITHIFPVLTP